MADDEQLTEFNRKLLKLKILDKISKYDLSNSTILNMIRELLVDSNGFNLEISQIGSHGYQINANGLILTLKSELDKLDDVILTKIYDTF